MSKGRYRRGAHTVTDFKYHFVWKTKYGYRVLKGEIGLRLRDIIRDICADNVLDIIKGNIRSNHIHLLLRAPSHLSPAKIIQYLNGTEGFDRREGCCAGCTDHQADRDALLVDIDAAAALDNGFHIDSFRQKGGGSSLENLTRVFPEGTTICGSFDPPKSV